MDLVSLTLNMSAQLIKLALLLLCRVVLCVSLNLHHFPVYREGSTNRSVYKSSASDQILTATGAIVSQDQSEKEFSVFIAQALQRVVNVVCYSILVRYFGLVVVNSSTCCMQQSFPKLQLEVNVMVLENGGSGMSMPIEYIYGLYCQSKELIKLMHSLQLLQHLQQVPLLHWLVVGQNSMIYQLHALWYVGCIGSYQISLLITIIFQSIFSLFMNRLAS